VKFQNFEHTAAVDLNYGRDSWPGMGWCVHTIENIGIHHKW